MELELFKIIDRYQAVMSKAKWSDLGLNEICDIYNLLVESKKMKIEYENNQKAEKAIKTAKKKNEKEEK